MFAKVQTRRVLPAVCLAVLLFPLRGEAQQVPAPQKVQPIEVKVFTASGVQVNQAQIDPEQWTYVLLHGWQGFFGKVMEPYYRLARELRRLNGKANVLVVEWRVPNNGPVKIPADLTLWIIRLIAPGLVEDYCRCVLGAPEVGRLIADRLKKLGILPSKTIVCGHSLGGQVAAFVGQHCREVLHAPLHAIVASDPAGPLFQGATPDKRLDKTDAGDVVVIHATSLLGDPNRIGTYDIDLEFPPDRGEAERHDLAREALTDWVARHALPDNAAQLLDRALDSIFNPPIDPQPAPPPDQTAGRPDVQTGSAPSSPEGRSVRRSGVAGGTNPHEGPANRRAAP